MCLLGLFIEKEHTEDGKYLCNEVEFDKLFRSVRGPATIILGHRRRDTAGTFCEYMTDMDATQWHF